jgi:hypothetical protein
MKRAATIRYGTFLQLSIRVKSKTPFYWGFKDYNTV